MNIFVNVINLSIEWMKLKLYKKEIVFGLFETVCR